MNKPADYLPDSIGSIGRIARVMTSEFYQGTLPTFIWPALEQLTQSIFCSLPHLQVYGSLDTQTQVWVGRSQNGDIISVVVFEIRQRTARVINEVCSLKAVDLCAFAQDLFRRHPQISAIVLHAVELNDAPLPYPLQRLVFSEDFVLSLPLSDADYLASLSRHTREKIRYHLARSRRKQPSLQFRVVRGQLINDADIAAVIRLNRARMLSKGRRFGMDSVEESRLQAILHERGLIAIIEIDNVVCAGLLCTVSGTDVFMHVIAHDPKYDDLRLGFLCCYLTIQSAIAAHMTRFHFLWGHYDYKTRLGGKEQPLARLVLYKTRLHMLRHPVLLTQHWVASLRRVVRKWWHS